MAVLQRVHYFTIQECKRVFWHQDYGVVRFNEMIANAQEYGLGTVCVAGISVENLPIHYRQFFFPVTPFSASEFLCTFWGRSYSNKYVSRITGKPDVVVIDRRLEACLGKAFFTWLENEGVSYRYPATGEKRFYATVRQHQSYPDTFRFRDVAPEPVSDRQERWPLSLDVLNEKEVSDTHLTENLEPAQRQSLGILYPEYFKPELPAHSAVKNDFCFKDRRLSVASSNDVELNSVVWSPATENPFHYGYAINNYEILTERVVTSSWQKEILIALQCLEPQFERLAQELTHYFDDNDYVDTLNKIKKNKYKTLLPLETSEQDALFHLAGLNTDDPEGHTIYDISKLTVSDMVTLWNHISSGGNQYQSFEIRTQKGMDDPAYRLFAVIGRGSRYYLIAHRGSRSCNALDSERCINYESDQPRMVRQQDYRKMLIAAIKGNSGAFGRTLDPYVFN